MQRFRRRSMLGAALVTCVLLGACSGSGSSASTPTSTKSPASTAPGTRGVARASGGCGTAQAAGATNPGTGDAAFPFTSDGQTRSYRLGVPASYDTNTPAPLVLNLHGSGSNALQESIYSRLPLEGGKRGYIVVTPDAVDGKWELAATGRDDRFLVSLLDDVEQRYCVDLDRVYAAGISLGAWKAAITACTHPDRFAAIALVAVEVAPGRCAIPVVAFHGTADPVVPYGSGADPGVVVTGPNAGLTGVEVNMANWARNGGCSPTKRTVQIGTDVEHWTYPGCRRGIDVEFYSIAHGGHTWPGSPIDVPALGRVTHTIDATKIALDWFAAHRQGR